MRETKSSAALAIFREARSNISKKSISLGKSAIMFVCIEYINQLHPVNKTTLSLLQRPAGRSLCYTFLIMAFVRRAYKIFLLLTCNLFFLLPGLLISTVFFLGKPRQLQLRTHGMMVWAKCLAAVLGLHIQITGQRPEQSGLFIASNHASYTDILIIGSIIPSVFIAKAEVRGWPLFGLLAQIGGTIFVKRELQKSTLYAVKETEEKLGSGINVVVFPEGTTDNGKQIERFRSSFFQAPSEARLPILPLSIYYAVVDGLPTAQAPENEMAWHNAPLLPHFWNLLSKKKVEVRVHFNGIIAANSGSYNRKDLAEKAYLSSAEGFRRLQGNATD
ncbi:MAG: hypothetical protein C0402_02670 [Thermodesulfovibrio sp.]|nr:hypothetical protein [Thermodesulfovibrio sp.]